MGDSARAPRLILLDVELSTLDDFEVLSRLKRGRATAAIPVIMLTSRDHISHVERAIARCQSTLRGHQVLF
jgi:CheY-like chemotaxis protein